MSSDKAGEKPARRKPKVSWARVIRPGLVGPKARLKSVVDGKQVNIPVPELWSDAGVEKGSRSSYWILVQACRGISLANPGGHYLEARCGGLRP